MARFPADDGLEWRAVELVFLGPLALDLAMGLAIGHGRWIRLIARPLLS